MKGYNSHQIDRIGNAVVYLAQKIKGLNKTQLLKLLYLIERVSVVKYQRPFFNMEFEVWKYGPVAKDVFIELTPDGSMLSRYIKTDCDCTKTTTIIPVSNFCDDEFSDADIELLDAVIEQYGELSATQLVAVTHKKNDLWYKLAVENELLDDFENGKRTSSRVTIDFSKLLDGCDLKKYNETLDTQLFINSYLK